MSKGYSAVGVSLAGKGKSIGMQGTMADDPPPPIPSFPAPPISNYLEKYKMYEESFDKPLPLAIKKATSIVTCMDARLLPDRMFGLDIGDAEYIRNAGGRVTDDVLRSLLIAQELLGTKIIILIHHTDCGGQAAVKHHDWLVQHVKTKLGVDLSKYNMLGIAPNDVALEDSVREDFVKLKESPLISPDIKIYGFVYDVFTARLKEIVRRE